MGFEELLRALTVLARRHVREGRISERALARLCHTSQPHLHNVLKGIRTLSPAAADRLMVSLRVTVPEILWGDTDELEKSVAAIPILRHRIGPGINADLTLRKGAFPVRNDLTNGLIDPLLARLSPDLVMPAELRHDDLVLLDQNPVHRADPDGQSLWIVADRGGLRARYIRIAEGRFFTVNEANLHTSAGWQPVAGLGENILNVVRARIVWISRKMEAK